MDAVHRTITVWNGGLPPVLLTGRDGQIVSRCHSAHLPLGITHDYDLNVEVHEYVAGNRIYMCSDGVTEMALCCAGSGAKNGEMLGQERLERLITDGGPESAFSRVDGFLREQEARCRAGDDVTFVEIDQAKGIEGAESAPSAVEVGKSGEWRLVVDLGAEALRRSDPIPLLINAMGEIQGLGHHRRNVFTILSELYNNALEHGLLALDSALKCSAEGFSSYYEQRESRLERLEQGYVVIECHHTPTDSGGRLAIRVENGGPGLEKGGERERSNPYSGRGLKLVTSLCESVERDASTHAVTAVYVWSAKVH
jgi:anti-sigma regulatory factor (Ser/Thr protein kinase)